MICQNFRELYWHDSQEKREGWEKREERIQRFQLILCWEIFWEHLLPIWFHDACLIGNSFCRHNSENEIKYQRRYSQYPQLPSINTPDLEKNPPKPRYLQNAIKTMYIKQQWVRGMKLGNKFIGDQRDYGRSSYVQYFNRIGLIILRILLQIPVSQSLFQ